MSKKLTKEMLDALIKEAMLQERTIDIKYPATLKNFDTGDSKKDIGLEPAELDKLSGEDGDKSDLTFDDYAQSYLDKEAEFKKLKTSGKPKYKKAANDVENLVAKGFTTSQAASELDPSKKLGFAQSKSLAFKTMNTISADPDDASAMGSFPEGIATATQTFFAGQNSLFSRIERINDFYNRIYKTPSGGTQKDRINNILKQYSNNYSELLSGVIFADYLSTLVQETDAGAAAYNFEALLAMMSGGRVKGKDTTDAGKMGVTDFITNKNMQGSAKYYTDYSGISQSSSGFKENEPIFYIIAIKMTAGAGSTTPSGKKGASGAGPTSDPQSIKELHVYNMIIMKTSSTDFLLKDGSGEIHEISGVGAKLKINKVEYYKNPAVLRIGRKSDDFQDALIKNMNTSINNATTDAEKNAAIVIKQMNIALENSQKATQKITAYASSGEKTTGDEAVKALKQAEAASKELASKGYGQTLSENKMAELDLMVENMVKQFLKG